MPGRWLAHAVVVTVLATVAVGFVYELAVATGGIALGTQPGEGPPGESTFLLVAVAALLLGAVVVVLFGVWGVGLELVPLLPLAGAAFALARWFAFDPYYLPTLRRASERGSVPGGWMAVVVLLAVGASVLAYSRPRLGAVVVALSMTMSAVTAFVTHLGH